MKTPKEIRINLPLQGQPVADLDDLRARFGPELIPFARKGALQKWLRQRGYLDVLGSLKAASDLHAELVTDVDWLHTLADVLDLDPSCWADGAQNTAQPIEAVDPEEPLNAPISVAPPAPMAEDIPAEVTLDAARIALAGATLGFVEVNGRSMGAAVARLLATWQPPDPKWAKLRLDGIKELTADVAEQLSSWPHNLVLTDLDVLPVETGRWLVGQAKSLSVGLRELPADLARVLAQKQLSLAFPRLERMSADTAEVLRLFKGELIVHGGSLEAEALARLAGRVGDTLLYAEELAPATATAVEAVLEQKRWPTSRTGRWCMTRLKRPSAGVIGAARAWFEDKAVRMDGTRDRDYLRLELSAEWLSKTAAEELAGYRGEIWLPKLVAMEYGADEAIAAHRYFDRWETIFGGNGLVGARLSLPMLRDLSKNFFSALNEKSQLDLSGLRGISVRDLSTLVAEGQIKGTLRLNGLTELTPNQANLLGSLKKVDIELKGITTIDAVVAKALADHEGSLYLDGLRRIDAPSMAALKMHSGDVSLGGLDGIEPDTARALVAGAKDERITVEVEALSMEVAEILAAHPHGLALPRLKHVSFELASVLGRQSNSLDLRSLAELDAAAARVLAANVEYLSLGLKQVDLGMAKALTRGRAGLRLPRVQTITRDVIVELASCRGSILELGLTEIDPHDATELARFKGSLCLDEARQVSQAALTILMRHQGDLTLGIDTISELLADAMLEKKGQLTLYSVQSLSSTVAKTLARRNIASWSKTAREMREWGGKPDAVYVSICGGLGLQTQLQEQIFQYVRY